MKDYEDEAFDELEKAQQRKVATGVTDGSKVTIDRAKLKQVLNALEKNTRYLPADFDYHFDAVDIIKEALEDV